MNGVCELRVHLACVHGPCMDAHGVACAWHTAHHDLLKITTGFSAMTLLISFCRVARSSGGCGLLESTEPIGRGTHSITLRAAKGVPSGRTPDVRSRPPPSANNSSGDGRVGSDAAEQQLLLLCRRLLRRRAAASAASAAASASAARRAGKGVPSEHLATPHTGSDDNDRKLGLG